MVDIGPLRRHRDFRLLFGARNISLFGSGITYVAVPYQVYQLSGSTLLVGLLGIVELAPLLFTALLGGALADWRDRRRMVLLSELGLALGTGVLLVNALLPDPQLWVLFVVVSVMAGLDGIRNKTEPPKPIDKNLYELEPEEAAKVKSMPGSLDQALDALEKDHDFLLRGDVFTKDVIETWLEYKRKAEVDAIRLRPHPWEFALYFDI